MKPLGKQYPGIYFRKTKKGKNLYTINSVPKKKVYDEILLKVGKDEFRSWDPKRSKLAAAILKGISQIGFKQDSDVLYLGASTGTTVSHISDILKGKGFIFALDFAPRVLRDLVFIAQERKNIAPLLEDANQPYNYLDKLTAVDYVYQDVAQKNQTEIFLKNCKLFLKPGCFGLLCVKARSIDVTKRPKEIYQKVRRELEKEMEIADYRVLDPFEKDHCVFLCKKR